MHAIIKTGGKQYSVAEGDVIFVEKLGIGDGEAVSFNEILAIVDGEKTTFGTPVVSGAKVDGKVVKNGKGKKINVFKFKAKKGYSRRQGHRQPYTKVQIEKITVS